MATKVAVIASLLGLALAQISASCTDITLDQATNILSADCMPRDHSGYTHTSLDLNNCFAYNGTIITPTRPGDLSSSCHDCHLYTAPDPWYTLEVYWMGCQCTGQSDEVDVPIEMANAHQYVTNEDGQLTC